MLGSLAYFFREAAVGLWRHRLMSLVAVATTALALFLLGLGLMAASVLNVLKGQLEQRLEIRVFLADKPVNVLQMQAELQQLPGVARVRFVSRTQALAELAERIGDSEGFLTSLPRNPLPDSFRIVATDSEHIGPLADYIREHYPVQQIIYGREYVDRFRKLVNRMKGVVAAVMGLFALSAGIIIGNTVRLFVTARREEIEIIALMGATRWFVRWPFILEGALLGLGAGVLASGVTWAAESLLLWNMAEFLGPLSLGTSLPIGWISLILAGVGTLTGALGATVTVGRHLRAL